MICTVQMGTTGSGKTEKSKELIRRSRRAVVYDYQENGDFDDLPIFDFENRLDKCRILASQYSYKDFRDIVENYFFDLGYLVVCEEASGMFETNNKDNQVNDFLLSKRHRKVNFLLNFHNPRQVPPFIMDYCDIVIVRNTTGGKKHLTGKFEDVRVLDCTELCKKDARVSYIIGVSGLTTGLFLREYYEGELVSEKIKSKHLKNK